MHKNFKRRSIHLLVLLIICSVFVVSPTVSANENETLSSIVEEFNLNNSESYADITEAYKSNTPNLYNINSSDRIYSNSDGNTIVIDSNGKLKSINQIPKESFKVPSKSTNHSKTQLIEKIESYVNKGFIDSHYYVSNISDYSDITQIVMFEENDFDIVNPFSSIKLGFNRYTGELLYFSRFDNYTPDYTNPKLTSDEAFQLLSINSSEIETKSYVSSKLTIIPKEEYQGLEYKVLGYTVAYTFTFSNGDEISVDANTGELLLIDGVENYIGSSFYPDETTEINNNRRYRATYLNATMNRLNYSSTIQFLSSSSQNRQKVISYFNGTHSWGFTFSGHASTTTLRVNESPLQRVYPSDISGVWSFVFLDGCNTATDTQWSNAFQIYANNSIGRVFMGWFDNIARSKSLNFTREYYNAVYKNPNTTLLNNIYNALANIPGDDFYPIRFVGDRNTTGYK